jgi:hypothetical protein
VEDRADVEGRLERREGPLDPPHGLAELGEQGLTVGGILLGCARVAADHVALLADPDLLDFEIVRDLMVAPWAGENVLLGDRALATQGAAADTAALSQTILGFQSNSPPGYCWQRMRRVSTGYRPEWRSEVRTFGTECW